MAFSNNHRSTLALIVLATMSCCLAPAGAQLNALQRQLGSYLPPVADDVQCQAEIRTTTIQQFRTTTLVQPFTVAQTRTMRAQALATATMAVTTTMERVERRQMQVPVTRTYQATAIATRTRVQQVPFQPPPVTSVFTSTAVSVQTSVNQQFVTRTQTSVRPVFITRTQFNTQFTTRFDTRTQLQTRHITMRNVERFATSTQRVVRTQQVQQPAFTSHVQTQVVQSSQAVQFITPRPFTRTQNVQSTVISTAVQQVFNTQTAVATREVTRTQFVQVTRTQVQTITSTRVMQQVVVRTRFVDRVVTSTQVVPQFITSTSIFNQINNQFVTETRRTTIVQTQTVQGLPNIQMQIVTSFSNLVQTITNHQQANPVTIMQTVTRPCQQQQQQQQQVVQTQSGYNYNAPSIPFNF